MKSKKIHIVYTINRLEKTGPNQVLSNMVAGVDREKFKVTVVSFLQDPDDEVARFLSDNDTKHICLNFNRKLDILTKGPKALHELLQEIAPDIVHSHGILSDIASYTSRYDSKYATTIHNDIFEDYNYTFGRLKGTLFAWWHIFYLKKLDKVVGCSSTSYIAIKKYLPHNSCFVRNGITTSNGIVQANAIRKNLGIDKDDLVFIYTGKLSERKNVLALLENFTTTHKPNEHLIILGNGELSEECSEYASSNIHLVGFKTNVADYLDASDIYVSASNSEGFSISVIEALEKGLYLLLSDIPSHKEAFEIDGKTYIGETFDKASFRIKKEQLTSKRLKKTTPIAFQKKHLSARAMMKNYEQIYMEMLK